MKTKTKNITILLVAVVAAYVLGAFVGIPNTSGVGAGNISKVSKYSKSVVSPAMSAFQEKIMNDSTARKQAIVSLVVINSRMAEFSKLVDIAAAAAEGTAELSDEIETLKTVQRLSDNAVAAGRDASKAFSDMLQGAKNNCANEYEQAAQNLSIAYMMVDRQLQVAKQYVAAVDSYLEGKSVDDNRDLALSRDLWANYCTGNANLNGDSSELAYWKEKGVVLDAKATVEGLNSFADSTLIASLYFDSMMGIGADEMKIGADEMKIGADEMKIGADEMKIGADEMKIGADEMKIGVDEMKIGADEMKIGVDGIIVGAIYPVDYPITPVVRNPVY